MLIKDVGHSMQKEADGSILVGFAVRRAQDFNSCGISFPPWSTGMAFWGQHRPRAGWQWPSKTFWVSRTWVAQHGATSAIQDVLYWDLTFVQFEDGVSHGCQHALSFQDVDIPQPQGEGEGGLFQAHNQKTSLLAPHSLALIDGMMIQRLVASLCPLAPKHTTG